METFKWLVSIFVIGAVATGLVVWVCDMLLMARERRFYARVKADREKGIEPKPEPWLKD